MDVTLLIFQPLFHSHSYHSSAIYDRRYFGEIERVTSVDIAHHPKCTSQSDEILTRTPTFSQFIIIVLYY